MKSRAFVGLSGPLLYDYSVPAEPGPADRSSSPNPILDSPYGLLLLYDEILFLTRSLCPQNMRDLPYVRFLDEEQRLPTLSDINVDAAVEQLRSDPASREREARVASLFRRYDEVLETLHVDWGSGPDNHTHTLAIGDVQTSANSVSLRSVAFDLEIVRRLDLNVEFVANSFAQRWLDETVPGLPTIDLAHTLVVDRIPNILFPDGPYHPVIEEARDNPHIKPFRKWVSSTAASREATSTAEIRREVQAAITETTQSRFLRYLDEHRLYLTQGKTLVAGVADLALPFVGTGATAIQNQRERRQAQDLRWQGFLISLERLAQD